MTSKVRGSEPVSNTPVKDAMIEADKVVDVVKTDEFGAQVVPFKEAQLASDPKFTKVNLAERICINGVSQGPGEGIWVPTDAFSVWGPAQAKDKGE